MKHIDNVSTSWVPHVVAFSQQIYFTHFGTGEVVLDGCLPRVFKISDIVAADTIASPTDGANLSESHRVALVTGPLPLSEVSLPPMQLKLAHFMESKDGHEVLEAAFFENLGINMKAEPDPVLMLLMRLFFLDKSPRPLPLLPPRPPCLPSPSHALLREEPDHYAARQKYAHDVLCLPFLGKIEALPRSMPRVFEKQSYFTNSLLLSFEGVKFEFADGHPLEPMFCSAVLVSRTGDGEFLSQTFHFDAVDEDLLRAASGGSITLNPLTRNKDVLLQLSSSLDTSVWLVVILEKSMGFHTQKPYMELGSGNITDLKQRLISNCKLYGKYRRPFVWGFTELYSRSSLGNGAVRNAPNPTDEDDLAIQVLGIPAPVVTQVSAPSHLWQMGKIDIPNLYLVSEFCENFSKPFSIFDSMNRIDSKRKQYSRVNGHLQFVLQPWSGSDLSSPGPHCVSSIAEGSEGGIMNCFLHRPSISFEHPPPPAAHRVVFSSHEPLLHSHMRCLRCYDELVNSLYITDMNVNLKDISIKKPLGERDNYVLRICFKESDQGELDGIVPAMVMKSSSPVSLATEAFTHVVMNVSHPHFLDEIRVELRPQLHPSSHLLITLLRVARRSKLSTFFKSTPSMDEKMPDVIVGHAVLKFSNSQELANCCSAISMLPLIEHPLKPGYLQSANNSYLGGGLRVVQCQLRLQSSVYPATPLMARMFSSLSSFHDLTMTLHQFISRGSGMSLACARRDLANELRDVTNELLQLTVSVDLLEVVAFFPAVATFIVHVICSSYHFYLYEKNRAGADAFADAQPLAVLCSQLSRQSLLSLMYFVNAIARQAQNIP
jgi:hypothetical protein